MADFLKKLQGKKTYLISIAIFVLGGLHAMGKIPESIYNEALVFLNGGAILTLRHAIAILLKYAQGDTKEIIKKIDEATNG